ncbi:hypothetical protein M011DRAFT_185018 [Sporormia fimetaria CBS 119925]|uniref:Uncharacterized protein n=1 Tax=Sporormia fimetaria CBS 119925 TaxID=1340428 RepID=A0A6A6VNT3_9PLEO|nr:hypothetical protein M011DRAFT_185018 [Sporormia fimetaria CBS 119925]
MTRVWQLLDRVHRVPRMTDILPCLDAPLACKCPFISGCGVERLLDLFTDRCAPASCKLSFWPLQIEVMAMFIPASHMPWPRTKNVQALLLSSSVGNYQTTMLRRELNLPSTILAKLAYSICPGRCELTDDSILASEKALHGSAPLQCSRLQ